MKRALSLAAALILLLSDCAPAQKTVTREERERFFDFADAYRLDLLPDFENGEVPVIDTEEGAPFVELIDYREESEGEQAMVTARYIEYSFPELQTQPDPKNHIHYEWARETVVDGDTEGFTVQNVADLCFYLPRDEEAVRFIFKRSLN